MSLILLRRRPCIATLPADDCRRNKILLQGDPQHIQKQRVETAIRVIIDVLRTIPPSPSNPNVSPSIATLLPQDPAGNILASFERLANFRGLRLQAGTTTKASSKKQLAAGAVPAHQLAYLETAVYMSGENGKRVYACKRCRGREERRRMNKDAARKKQITPAVDPDTPAPQPKPSQHPPTEDYITGVNSAQYDPHRVTQVVEEPPWDPAVPDWRHEIVLFNSAPEMPMKDGSCYWLPFRVICYCKCHGEKVGFRIKFTLRTFDGRIIASEMTNPIKITDDHKTDAKSKPRADRLASATPAPSRPRKGRMSTASSQRQSPAPSESEMSVASEVGPSVQKQTPQVRQNKPYDRPPSQSPAVQSSNLPPFDFMSQVTNERPRLSREPSTSSYASPADITNWTDALQQVTVSPDALRRPDFGGLTALNLNAHNLGVNGVNGHANGQRMGSTDFGTMPNGLGGTGVSHQNDLYGNSLNSNSLNSNSLTSGSLNAGSPLDLSSLSAGMPSVPPMMFGNNRNGANDVDMGNNVNLENMLFNPGHSTQNSISSSYQDDQSSVFSGFQQGSLYSESGLPPESALDDMIDYSGGESTGAVSPMQHLNLSPTAPMGQLDLSGVNGHQSPYGQASGLPPAATQAEAEAQTRALLQMLGRPQQPSVPTPTVSHVIPAEGDMAGGTPVAIAGSGFTRETVIVFGGRPATTSFVSDSFLQCTLPPSPVPGEVPVTVQNVTAVSVGPGMMFKYTGMDKEMMRLMLEVRQLHGSQDPAVRLVDHIARSNHNSDMSDRSSPNGNNSSPFDSDAPKKARRPSAPKKDLQTTLIECLEVMDESSPGSLRRSGVVNHANKAQQTLLHVAAVMGFHRLLRRLVVVGAHLNTQDINGFTPLAFAALCGQPQCARVLLEAGASYDVPTSLGEMPLDLAKLDDGNPVESILLSAVWATAVPEEDDDRASILSFDDKSEIDDDNPSSDDSDGANSTSDASRILRQRRMSRKAKSRVKRRMSSAQPTVLHRRPTPENITHDIDGTVLPMPHEDPPPYTPPNQPSWMSRTISNISHPIQDKVLHNLPFFNGDKVSLPNGWVAFPAPPSWDTLKNMTNPEDIKLFTQAMAAAAFNAVVQSGATTSSKLEDGSPATRSPKKWRRRRSSVDSRSSRDIQATQVVKQVKQDRMLYLFWLPVLLFVGFWLLVTALPIATGFCLLYARQISRAIKQRL